MMHKSLLRKMTDWFEGLTPWDQRMIVKAVCGKDAMVMVPAYGEDGTSSVRRAVIEELAREAEKGLYDEDLIFEDAAWRLAKAEGSRFAAWLRRHVEEAG